MSLSNPTLKNPCKKFIKFSGDTGIFSFYDKEKGEKGEKVFLEYPFRFIVLDQLNTINGFSEKYESGIYSNEVHNLTNETLRVKSFKGDFSAIGLYNEISDEIKAAGGKFCKSVYALLKVDENLELVNFQFSGSSFSAWLDFCKKIDLTNYGVFVDGQMTEGKKGAVIYKMPIFQKLKLDEKIIKKAIDEDKKLQEYLRFYKNQKPEEKIQEQIVKEEIIDHSYVKDLGNKKQNEFPAQSDDDLPF